ncbi:MAG TPA: 50S ribosomal protein L19 [Candidatus Azoamicus sp. OHIO1]
MKNIIKKIESIQIKKDIPKFKTGDTVCVSTNIIDNKSKNRKQHFEGIVIARHNNGIGSTFTLRKISLNEGIEKLFQLHSPNINSIEVKKIGLIRKAKIYYIRKLTGKAARIKEKIIKKP